MQRNVRFGWKKFTAKTKHYIFRSWINQPVTAYFLTITQSSFVMYRGKSSVLKILGEVVWQNLLWSMLYKQLSQNIIACVRPSCWITIIHITNSNVRYSSRFNTISFFSNRSLCNIYFTVCVWSCSGFNIGTCWFTTIFACFFLYLDTSKKNPLVLLLPLLVLLCVCNFAPLRAAFYHSSEKHKLGGLLLLIPIRQTLININ